MLDIDTKLLLPCGLVGRGCAKSGQKCHFCVVYVWQSTMFDIQYVVSIMKTNHNILCLKWLFLVDKPICCVVE